MYDLESLDSYGTNMQQVGRQRLWPSKISSQNAIIRANYALKFGNWYFEQYVPKPILDNANLPPKDMHQEMVQKFPDMPARFKVKAPWDSSGKIDSRDNKACAPTAYNVH